MKHCIVFVSMDCLVILAHLLSVVIGNLSMLDLFGVIAMGKKKKNNKVGIGLEPIKKIQGQSFIKIGTTTTLKSDVCTNFEITKLKNKHLEKIEQRLELNVSIFSIYTKIWNQILSVTLKICLTQN